MAIAGTLVLSCNVSAPRICEQLAASGDYPRQLGVDGRLVKPLFEDWHRGSGQVWWNVDRRINIRR
jgi:hypothetical protein